MNDDNAPVYLFKKHDEADAAIRLLMKSGFEAKQLSLIGKGDDSEDQPVAFDAAGSKARDRPERQHVAEIA